MPDISTSEIKEFLLPLQGKEVTLADIRKEFNIVSGTNSFNLVRNIMFQLAESKVVKPTGKRNGVYKVIEIVKPVQVFGTDRLRRPPIKLYFPRDFTTEMEMSFAECIVIREGDLITIGGVKSTGKTTLCLNFCAENIDSKPVLMGNEYTLLSEGVYEPAPRFLQRLDRMREWVEWADSNGMDKFTLLPVREDYPEHVEPGRINIIDWINLDGNELYDIGKVLGAIKSAEGRGVTIAVLQKGEGALNPRGGQFVRDFSDLEILLDPFGKNDRDILLTIKGAKESTKPIVGKTFAYTIGEGGTKMFNFREVKRCKGCVGSGKHKGYDCEECYGSGYRDA